MNFDLSEDQFQIRDTVARLVADKYGVTSRKAFLAAPCGWSRDVWAEFSQLGLTALGVPEPYGGLGGSAVDQYVVMQALGRGAILEPYLVSCVVAARAISEAASDAQRLAWLPKLASGEHVYTWAHRELHRSELTRASRTGSAWALTGAKQCVLQADAADHLLVSAKVGDESTALFLVDRAAPGLVLRTYRLLDDTTAADVTLDRVPAIVLGATADDGAMQAIGAAEDAAAAALCAEAVGAMRAALDLTIAHLQTRTQFGQPLAANQALRHRVADMAVMLECSDSMAMLAALTLSDPEGCDRGDLAAAKVVVGRYGRSLCEQAVQLHGGIGMTEEYGVGRYLQRLLVMDQLFGSSDERIGHLNQLHRSNARPSPAQA